MHFNRSDRLHNLKVLEMRETGMHTLPSCLSKLSKLEKLDIGANDLTSLRELYQNGNNLQELTVDQNRLRRIPGVRKFDFVFFSTLSLCLIIDN